MNRIVPIAWSLCMVLSFVPLAIAADNPDVEARAAIEAGNAKFSEAFARGDASALAAMYTTDAILFPPGEEMLRGNVPIGEYWKKARDGGVASATLATTDVDRSGDAAFESGKVTLTIQSEGKPAKTVTEKYLVVWKRQPDGGWKLHRDIWNALPAAK